MTEQDTLKASIIGEAALMMARIYKQHVYPLKYERVFYLDGVRVKVLIDQYKSVDDTHPLRSEA